MADDKVPTADQAVERIVGQLKKMREQGATVTQQQGYLKSQLLSNKVVYQQDRTEVLKKVNHSIGTSWSMTKVKGADHTPFVDAKPKSQPIPVDELHGSSTVDMAGSSDQGSGKGVTVKVVQDDQMPKDDGGVKADVVIGGRRMADTEQSREATEVLEDNAMIQDRLQGENIPVNEKGATAGKAVADLVFKTAETSAATAGKEHKFKMTDLPGDRGVSVKVMPDEEIPKDENGNKAEIIVPLKGGLRLTSLEELVVKRQQETLMAQLDEGDEYIRWNTSDTHIDHTIRLASGDIIEISMNAENQVIKRINHTEIQRAAQQAVAATTTQTQSEESNMQAQANNTNTTESTNKETTMTDFANIMSLRGAATPELRQAAFYEYIDTKSPTTKQAFEVFSAVQPASSSSDQRIFEFLSTDSNKAFTEGFMIWVMSEYTPHVIGAEAKSRWSLMGERDEGIRSSWIGAGAAIIGGGMEMASTGGGLTLGSGIGTLVGAGAAFFAGEFIDSNIESQFGRYVAAGTLGLGLGAAGSALGRSLLPGKRLLSAGSSINDVDGNAPVQVVVPGASTNLGLIAGL